MYIYNMTFRLLVVHFEKTCNLQMAFCLSSQKKTSIAV